MKSNHEFDFLIVGGGIIGLALALNLVNYFPNKKICIIDKESTLGFHASGRNSGVIHSGIYYKRGSLKSIFSKEGNKFFRDFCIKNNIKIRSQGKLIVAKNEKELERLFFLKNNAENNNIEVFLGKENELKEFEVNAKTFQYFLYVPSTFVIDPKDIINFLFEKLMDLGVVFLFDTKFKKVLGNNLVLIENKIKRKVIINYGFLINCAGLYADVISHNFNLALNYKIIPFKGLYLNYNIKDSFFINKSIYPVPDLRFPFLGVHFTVSDNIKVGPTATLALYKENYNLFYRFNLKEFFEVLSTSGFLFIKKGEYRKLFFNEFKKNIKFLLYKEASSLVKNIPSLDNFSWYMSGIRAQLVDIKKMELVDDFVIEIGKDSLHILNAVSPAFTASFPFTEYVVKNYILNKFNN